MSGRALGVAAGTSGEMLQEHLMALFELGACAAWFVLGTPEKDLPIGQSLLPQQEREAQHPFCWTFAVSNGATGMPDRKSESTKAQALFVIFMPYFLIANECENWQAKREASSGPASGMSRTDERIPHEDKAN